MKTSSYFTFDGPGRVGISVYAPRGLKKGYRIHKILGPSADMLKMDYPEYREIFMRDRLGVLDPQEQWDKVHELAAGAEPVMLCYESGPLTKANWCHRRLVAEWFETKLGHVVEEIGYGNVPAMIGGPPPPDLLDDPSPFFGRTGLIAGKAYEVMGADAQNPGQATVKRIADGCTFTASVKTLTKHFG